MNATVTTFQEATVVFNREIVKVFNTKSTYAENYADAKKWVLTAYAFDGKPYRIMRGI
jgi:hypothetical protein